jgi:hypothetical protein
MIKILKRPLPLHLYPGALIGLRKNWHKRITPSSAIPFNAIKQNEQWLIAVPNQIYILASTTTSSQLFFPDK